MAETLAAVSGHADVREARWGTKLAAGNQPALAVIGLAGNAWSTVFGLTPHALDEARIARSFV